MKRITYSVTQSGRYLFAIPLIAFGVVQIVTGNFLKELFPVPASLPGRVFLVYFFSIAFIIAGIYIVINRVSMLTAALLGLLLFILILYPHLPRLISNLYKPDARTSFFEATAICSGAFILAGNHYSNALINKRLDNIINRINKYSHVLFAIALIVFGIQHFMYAKYVMTQMPTWVSAHLFWSYLIRVAFIATAISILWNIQRRLAATLLGAMFLLWIFLIHIPGVATNLNSETEWVGLFVAMAMCGISFMLTGKSKK